MTKITRGLLAISGIMLCFSCTHKQTERQKEEIVVADTFIWSEAPAEPTEEEEKAAHEKMVRERNHEDSVWAYVKFPKPEVELIYSGSKGQAVAKRVQEIYDDVLENGNFMFNEKKDFLKLYWSKSLYAYYMKACEHDDCVLGADPYTGAQGYECMHLYKVDVKSVKNNSATADVTFGTYSKEGIFKNNITLSLVFERGNWYIDDMRLEDSMSTREQIADSQKYNK